MPSEKICLQPYNLSNKQPPPEKILLPYNGINKIIRLKSLGYSFFTEVIRYEKRCFANKPIDEFVLVGMFLIFQQALITFDVIQPPAVLVVAVHHL